MPADKSPMLGDFFLKAYFAEFAQILFVSDVNACLLTGQVIKCWVDPERSQAYFGLNIYDTWVEVALCEFRVYTEVINNVIYHDRVI